MNDEFVIDEDFIKRNMQSGKPIIRGVYFLFYRNELIYIGTSQNIEHRLKHHKKHSFFEFDKYFIYPTSFISEHKRGEIEKACIRKYKPKYNLFFNPDFESGKNKVWFTFISQWKSYKDVSKHCNLPIAMCKRVINGTKNIDPENSIMKIEKTILSREKSLPIYTRSPQ